jgi:hypothetical protein
MAACPFEETGTTGGLPFGTCWTNCLVSPRKLIGRARSWWLPDASFFVVFFYFYCTVRSLQFCVFLLWRIQFLASNNIEAKQSDMKSTTTQVSNFSHHKVRIRNVIRFPEAFFFFVDAQKR